jgi:hypothetical protein
LRLRRQAKFLACSVAHTTRVLKNDVEIGATRRFPMARFCGTSHNRAANLGKVVVAVNCGRSRARAQCAHAPSFQSTVGRHTALDEASRAGRTLHRERSGGHSGPPRHKYRSEWPLPRSLLPAQYCCSSTSSPDLLFVCFLWFLSELMHRPGCVRLICHSSATNSRQRPGWEADYSRRGSGVPSEHSVPEIS